MSKILRTPRQIQFQQILVETRLSKKLSQAAVAKRLGLPQSFVAKYETGERKLNVVEYCDVARAMDADPVELLAELLSREPPAEA
jgi:transcriptional regulator with XRE-family HTH domain